ncbi:MAG TPA: cupredoxin domain-containing protein [Candidatus Dormibacteraeota bacterium]|nr:cupredoxin domain-containing protein [Candidatus Dormibacteraeota bacterium]
MIPRRVVVLVIAIMAVLMAAIIGYVYLSSLSPANSGTKPGVTTINIPQGSYIEPSGFNLTRFQTEFATGAYPYPVNITVTIGINNTIEWVNKDTQPHTATAIVAPQGIPLFNSGLILPGKTFSVTLTTPGAYRYTCAWHNWLAGQIIVKRA